MEDIDIMESERYIVEFDRDSYYTALTLIMHLYKQCDRALDKATSEKEFEELEQKLDKLKNIMEHLEDTKTLEDLLLGALHPQGKARDREDIQQ